MVDAADQEPVPVETESLASYLELNPEISHDIFGIINDAVQEILPGSDYHERYQGKSEVGLAIAVVGVDELNHSGSLKPLGYINDDWYSGNEGKYVNDSQYRLAFSANNYLSCRDEATWTWNWEKDSAVLGGNITPEIATIGRYAVVATAKIDHLADQPEAMSSHWVGGENIDRGKVGFAGAKAVGTPETGGVSLVATSGLWEVHDHIVSAVFSQAVEMKRQDVAGELDNLDIAGFVFGELIAEFEKVDQILATEGKTAAEISEDRAACNDLIKLLEYDYAVNAQRLAGITY